MEAEAQQKISDSQARVAEQAARDVVEQLTQIMGSLNTPFLRKPRPGYQRGIDFYSGSGLVKAIAMAAIQFRNAHGRMPDLLTPDLLTDKIFRSKFFRQMKVPETGNKLLTSFFIPEEVRGFVSTPPIVWHSTEARIPRNDEIAPGVYYLKTSHGAGMFKRLVYPLAEGEAETLDLEFAKHLSNRYGLTAGEWWYSKFTPELMLEKAVHEEEHTVAWDFYVIDGRIPIGAAFQKSAAPQKCTYVTETFAPAAYQNPKLDRADYREPSPETKKKMIEAAHAIGDPLGFARVDFLLGEDEQIYLGEVTFTPGSGLNRFPSDLDRRLGQMWSVDS